MAPYPPPLAPTSGFAAPADVLKALAIVSDTTVRRSAVDRDDLKLYWE